ncbi:MAG: hypothetical protein H0X17_17905 [Deltaproteobacteria bacterium]|nr:hypothetical protein [Deltaproteobacteria bacterium]
MQPNSGNPQSFQALADNALPPLERIEVEHTRHDRALSHGEPSTPILGLPLARLIPQDVHAVMDYAHGLLAASCAIVADDPRAKIASLVLAGSVIGVSAITDYRLSVAKVVPIEAHEVIDHVWGVAAIAAPFVLGYYKTEPKIAMMHVIAGAGNILGSLVTDYRAYTRRRGS